MLDHLTKKIKMFKILIVVFAVCYVQEVRSVTELEVKMEFMKLAMKCMKDHPVDVADLMPLQQYIVPTKPEMKCLLACAYKLDGIMTKDGLYNKEHAYKLAERMKNGDETRLENGKKMADVCDKEVNEAEVTDGEKGCDRAAFTFKCMAENAPKFGFKLV